MRKLYDDIAAAILKSLPGAMFSFDISAWAGVDRYTKWYSSFKDAKYISFINTSGGQVNANFKLLNFMFDSHYFKNAKFLFSYTIVLGKYFQHTFFWRHHTFFV